MTPDGKMPPVFCIAGPTASGKSELALALARALCAQGQPAAIVNADASQIYADIPILSAAPTTAERADVPHHLFGHVAASGNMSAAQWAAEARGVLAECAARGVVMILVGGTGLYIRTLLDGISDMPAIAADIRAAVRAMPVDAAYAALRDADAAGAAALHPHDSTRIARALEVVRATGRPIGTWRTQKRGGIAGHVRLLPLLLLPPRDWLRARIAARVTAMWRGGAVDEVATLLARNVPPSAGVMRAIGVPQIGAYLSGECDEPAAKTAMIAATHQYAKRQYTWFRNQSPGDWPRLEAPLNDVEIDSIVIKLQQKLLTE
ncbi:MAG: tRNA (adenosine(37)-N6)-dimethylallyltransferase MiaA [Sphingomonadaceae bacterium]|nr:tRNA (adenosine(37)-N6)-dimethylallyltransferase MiaA [Sphingomonadaceae bacterium]